MITLFARNGRDRVPHSWSGASRGGGGQRGRAGAEYRQVGLSGGAGIAARSVWTIETALQRFRDRMTDGRSNLSDVTALQRVRSDLPDTVQFARDRAWGNARLLRGVLREVEQL